MKKKLFLATKIVAFAVALHLITSSMSLALAQTAQPSLETGLFRKLQNVPTLALANPRLESNDYAALGLKVITAPANVKQTILNYEKNRPSLATPNLNKCPLQAVNVETDNNPKTWEWLVTYPNACARLNAGKVKSFWLVQRSANGQLQVLLAERAYQVRIWQDKPSHNGRRIEVMLQDSVGSRYNDTAIPVQCYTMYQFNGRQYSPMVHSVQVYRDDPMSAGKDWRDVTGADPYAQVDQHYQCRED